jgi:hypothetical protein
MKWEDIIFFITLTLILGPGIFLFYFMVDITGQHLENNKFSIKVFFEIIILMILSPVIFYLTIKRSRNKK